MSIREEIDNLFGRARQWMGLGARAEPAETPADTGHSSVRAAIESLFGRVGATVRSPFARSGSVSDPMPDPGDIAARRLGEATRRQDGTASLAMLVAHQEQFAAKWGAGINVYWSRFDEALRDNWLNALAMRRSSFIEEMMNSRKLPIAGMDWHIEVDDSSDPDQKKIAEQLHKGIEAIPGFNALRYYLGEDKWQGKYGAQVTWGPVPIDGEERITVTSHEPVDGDSIVYKYDKTPGILLRTGWAPPGPGDQRFVEDMKPEWIQATDRARALFLYDQFWRDHFIISNFNPRSADYLYGGDQAAAIFGVGYRGMVYWDFQLREELRSWLIEALQRIGVNGMLYGFFESGNATMMKEVLMALKLIIRDNVTAFPYLPGQDPKEIQHIEPSQVGYDILAHWINEQEESMRRCILGQSLSAMAQSTGMGSETAKLHEQTFQHIIRSDAAAQQETLTKDLLGPMVRMNEFTWRGKRIKGTLPFRPRFVYTMDKADAAERANVIQIAWNMGVPLDLESVRSDLGLAVPKDPANVLKKPDDSGPPAGGAKHPEALAALAHANSKAPGGGRLNITRGPDGKMRIAKAKAPMPQPMNGHTNGLAAGVTP